MNVQQFWALIDATLGTENPSESLTKVLEILAPEEIIEFRLRHDDATLAANTTNLGGVAHLISGGTEDDGFYYFREWLVEMGSEVYHAALKNPDSLASLVTPGEVYEGEHGFSLVPVDVWCAKTGRSEDEFFTAVDLADANNNRSDPNTGPSWDYNDKDEIRERFPNLAAKYLKPA